MFTAASTKTFHVTVSKWRFPNFDILQRKSNIMAYGNFDFRDLPNNLQLLLLFSAKKESYRCISTLSNILSFHTSRELNHRLTEIVNLLENRM